jgi:hypothetical protein
VYIVMAIVVPEDPGEFGRQGPWGPVAGPPTSTPDAGPAAPGTATAPGAATEPWPAPAPQGGAPFAAGAPSPSDPSTPSPGAPMPTGAPPTYWADDREARRAARRARRASGNRVAADSSPAPSRSSSARSSSSVNSCPVRLELWVAHRAHRTRRVAPGRPDARTPIRRGQPIPSRWATSTTASDRARSRLAWLSSVRWRRGPDLDQDHRAAVGGARGTRVAGARTG